MPIYGNWLAEEPATDEQLMEVLRPRPAERMTAWQVSNAVSCVKSQGADFLEPAKS